MSPLWSSQPFKAIYTLAVLLKTPPLLALLYVRCLVRPLRPVSAWNAKKHILVAIGQTFFRYITATRAQQLLFTEPEGAAERHARVDPPASYLFSGALAATDVVQPGPVDAIWFPGPPFQGRTEMKKQKIVLHFPGGAFIMKFGYAVIGTAVANIMAKHMKADRVIWAQYRLSGTPESRFPAALQDALTFYQYVLDLGVEPGNIIISGDSAGGNVAIALLRYVEASQIHGQPLPPCGGAIVFSPWVEVTGQATRDYDQSNNSKFDVLNGPFLQWGVDAYMPEGELSSEVEAYISPLNHPFKLSAPLFVHAGAAEGFYGPISRFAEQMMQVNGDRVRFHTTPNAPHDILLMDEYFGMEEELGAAIEGARDLCERST